jgi:hypothetical protein
MPFKRMKILARFIVLMNAHLLLTIQYSETLK